MSKRNIVVSLALLMITLTVGCGSDYEGEPEEKKIAVTSPTVSEILEEKTSDANAEEASTAIAEEADTANVEDATIADADAAVSASTQVLSTTEGVDIDLTTLSSTMVYGQVYNMMFYPENFVGKTIRMQGLYSDYFDEAKGKHYFACIIMDATACCSQGIEFELTGDYTYPDEYPIDGDLCTVEGVFELYEEDGYQYCTLRNAKLVKDSGI